MDTGRQSVELNSAVAMQPTTIELVDRLPAGAVLTEDGILVIERGATPEETAARILAALRSPVLGN